MKFFRKNWPIYLAVIAGFTGLSLLGSRAFGAVRVYRDALAMPQTTVVLDAGHGGADGGAVSCTGARECEINLAITQRLDDLLHLLGCPTLQLRQGDTDLASADAASISEKKVTDLKNRVARINQQADAVLVSIHQNQFSQSQYLGAQVFYAPNTESRAFAALMQQNLRAGLDPGNKRECKPGSGIFLLEKIECPGILVECGFLSNPGEEALLRSKDYQKRLAAVLAGSITAFLAGRTAV